MSTREAKDLIGLNIVYKDFLGFERSGKIGWFENYTGRELDIEGGEVVWLYIVDEDPEYNDKELFIELGTVEKPDSRQLMYADLRLSNEVIIDED